MKSLQLLEYGELNECLAFNEIDKPIVRSQDVLIEVKAAAINPIDKSIIAGNLRALLPIPLPATLGYDVSGVVVGPTSLVLAGRTRRAVRVVTPAKAGQQDSRTAGKQESRKARKQESKSKKAIKLES